MQSLTDLGYERIRQLNCDFCTTGDKCNKPVVEGSAGMAMGYCIAAGIALAFPRLAKYLVQTVSVAQKHKAKKHPPGSSSSKSAPKKSKTRKQRDSLFVKEEDVAKLSS